MDLDEEIKILLAAKQICGSGEIADIIKTADQIRGYFIAIKKAPTEPTTDFLERCSVQHPVRGVIPFKPYPYQNRVFDFYNSGAKLSMVIMGRQMGLTSLLGFYALHEAIHKPDQTIVLISNKFAMSVEWMERIKTAMTSGRLLLPSIRENNKGLIEFDNGSRIIARTCNENALRGMSPTHVLIDNAAYISYATFERFWQYSAFLMSLSTRFIIQSTPRLSEGTFYELYQRAPQNGAQVLAVPYTEHPERDEQWVEATKNQMGEASFRSDYCCEFIKPDR